MIRLSLPKDPYWIDIIPGVRTRVRPINSIVAASAQATVDRLISDMIKDRVERLEVNAPVDGLPDLDDPDVRAGVSQVLYKKAIARHAIIAWEGVLGAEGDDPAPVNHQTVGDFMMIPRVADAFYVKYAEPLMLLNVEKKGSGTAPIGTGSQAAVPATAAAAAPAA